MITLVPTRVDDDEPVPPPDVRHVPAWRTARALGWLEAKRLLRATLIPAVLGVLITIGSGGDVVDLTSASASAAFTVLLLAAVTLVASHRAVTRPRRDGADELVETLPAPATARTGGHLLAVLAPTALAVGVIGATTWASFRADVVIGELVLAELAVGPVLVAGAGCLGVLLGRVWPQRFTPYAACVAIAALELGINTPRLAGSGARWLVFWVEGSLLWLLPRPSGAHLVYLVGLTAMAATGALLWDRRSRPLVVAGGITVLVTLVAAGLQMRQPADHWRRAEATFGAPETVQSCSTRDGVRYCLLDVGPDIADHYHGMVASVRSLVPDAAWPPELEVSQRVTALDLQWAGGVHRWLPHVPSMPDDRIRQPDDSAIHPALEFGWSTVQELGFGVQVAAVPLGLPLVPDPDTDRVCSAAGQARAVVALWLGAHATDDADDALAWLASTAATAAADSGVDDDEALVTVAEVEVYGGFAFGLDDARLAVRLLRADPAEVKAALSSSWDLVADPATPSSRLATLFGASGGSDGGSGRLVHEPHLATVGAACR